MKVWTCLKRIGLSIGYLGVATIITPIAFIAVCSSALTEIWSEK